MTDAVPASINPFDERFLEDPYAYHDSLREAGAVLWLSAIGA
jgi:4-methoxybenzoate monooxygenase (O-demethylating)